MADVWRIVCLVVLNIAVIRALSITAQGGLGIVDVYPLRLNCSYTLSPGETATHARWYDKNTPIPYTTLCDIDLDSRSSTFSSIWLNANAVFKGNYNETLHVEIPAESVRRDLHKSYGCAVSGDSGNVNRGVSVEILDNSSLTNTSYGIKKRELISGSLYCSSQANEQVRDITYTWSTATNTSKIGKEQSMSIGSISRRDAAIYVCKKTVTLPPFSGRSITLFSFTTVNLTVEHGPAGGVTFKSEGTTPGGVIEDEDFTETCVADCVPACEISWKRDNQIISNTSSLTLKNVQRGQAGVYVCHADNGEWIPVDTEFVLDVYYLDKVNLEMEKHLIDDIEFVNFSCNVVSNPTATMTITNNHNITLFYGQTNRGRYVMESPICDVSGLYTCTAENNQIPRYATSDKTELTLICSGYTLVILYTVVACTVVIIVVVFIMAVRRCPGFNCCAEKNETTASAIYDNWGPQDRAGVTKAQDSQQVADPRLSNPYANLRDPQPSEYDNLGFYVNSP